MKPFHRRFVLSFALALAAAGAVAQDFPQPGKAVRIVVPYSAGGPSDVLARVLSKELATALGTPVIVENKGEASGSIGAAEVARFPADGYTLLFALEGLVTQVPHAMRTYPFDALKGLTPLMRVAQGSFVFVTSPGKNMRTLSDVIARAKAQPGKLTFGSFGPGSTAHIFGEVLGQSAGIQMVHVPYKGSAPAQQDLIAGHIDVLFDASSSAASYAKDGRMVVIGVAAEKRDPLLPEMPTFSEQGVKGLEQGSWVGVFSASGLPPAVLSMLHAALQQAARSKSWADTIRSMASNPCPRSPRQRSPALCAPTASDGRVTSTRPHQAGLT